MIGVTHHQTIRRTAIRLGKSLLGRHRVVTLLAPMASARAHFRGVAVRHRGRIAAGAADLVIDARSSRNAERSHDAVNPGQSAVSAKAKRYTDHFFWKSDCVTTGENGQRSGRWAHFECVNGSASPFDDYELWSGKDPAVPRSVTPASRRGHARLQDAQRLTAGLRPGQARTPGSHAVAVDG